jgi:hypothetical protein
MQLHIAAWFSRNVQDVVYNSLAATKCHVAASTTLACVGILYQQQQAADDKTTEASSKQQCLLQPDSWSPVGEGFVGDPWLSITLTLCHILHSVSHWPVLVYFIKTTEALRQTAPNGHPRRQLLAGRGWQHAHAAADGTPCQVLLPRVTGTPNSSFLAHPKKNQPHHAALQLCT